MSRYVAFLRAVNVGGGRTLKMDILRQIFERFGFSRVSTFIASGNVVFETAARNASVLEERIEKGLVEAFGYEATPFIRNGAELSRIAALNPFPKTSIGAADELGIIFLSTPPNAAVRRSLKALPSETDELRVHGREIYWLRHRGAGGEVYSTIPFDKAIDQPFTVRSVRTVRKIADKYFPRG